MMIMKPEVVLRSICLFYTISSSFVIDGVQAINFESRGKIDTEQAPLPSRGASSPSTEVIDESGVSFMESFGQQQPNQSLIHSSMDVESELGNKPHTSRGGRTTVVKNNRSVMKAANKGISKDKGKVVMTGQRAGKQKKPAVNNKVIQELLIKKSDSDIPNSEGRLKPDPLMNQNDNHMKKSKSKPSCFDRSKLDSLMLKKTDSKVSYGEGLKTKLEGDIEPTDQKPKVGQFGMGEIMETICDAENNLRQPESNRFPFPFHR